MNKSILLASLLAAVALVACGKKEVPVVEVVPAAAPAPVVSAPVEAASVVVMPASDSVNK